MIPQASENILRQHLTNHSYVSDHSLRKNFNSCKRKSQRKTFKHVSRNIGKSMQSVFSTSESKKKRKKKDPLTTNFSNTMSLYKSLYRTNKAEPVIKGRKLN